LRRLFWRAIAREPTAFWLAVPRWRFLCTRETWVATTPAHRQANSKTVTRVRRVCHKSGTSASVRG
jgi:hypothetical protein